MKISTYFQQARSVAVYLESAPHARFFYPCLGLVGETGELWEKFEEEGLNADKNEIKKEMGDVLWYIANTLIDIGYTSDDFIAMFVDPCQPFEDLFTNLDDVILNTNMAFQTRISMQSPVIPLGKIAEIAKKTLRDSDGVIPEDKKRTVMINITKIMISLTTMAKAFGLSLDEIAMANIKKLFSRRDRGVLQGSGDNR